jgi:hypothetical protein
MFALNNQGTIFGEDGDYENRFYDYDYGSDYVSEREWEENRKALSASHEPSGDTYYGMTLDQYVDKIESLDFDLVLAETFTHAHCGRERQDSQYIFAHREGWLILLETYTSDNGFHEGEDQGFGKPSANTIELHYNWQPDHLDHRANLTSNGGFIHHPNTYDQDGELIAWGDRIEPAIWSGHHDVREGLKHTMESLSNTGTILNPWEKNTMHWMCAHHAVKEQDRGVPPGPESKAEWDRWVRDMNILSRSYFDKLPDWVKTMIGEYGRN